MAAIGLTFLLLLTLLRAGLFFYFDRQGYSLFKVTDAFFLGLRYDLRSVSLLLLILLVLGSLRPFHPFETTAARRLWMVFFTIISAIVLLFYVVDFAHYSYLRQRLNASDLNYLQDLGISMNMVWETYPVIRLLLVLVLGTVFLMWLIRRFYRKIAKSPVAVTKRKRVTGFIVCFLVLGFFIFGQFNQYPLRWSDAFALGSDYKANLALNPFESFFNTLKFRHSKYDVQKVKALYPLMAGYLGIDQPDSNKLVFTRTVPPRPDSLRMDKPNVVVVICESFSAYKSSMWGNPLNTTPFFDSLSRNGLFFDHCFTPTYGTARGVWAVVTGIPDVETPTTASRNPAIVDQHTILNDFKGYQRFYFIGGSTSWANIRGVLTNNIEGVHIYEQPDYDAPKIDVWGVSDKNLFLGANKVLAKQSGPFFAVIQTADNHRPYTIPEEDRQAFHSIDVPADSLHQYGFESVEEFNAFRYTDFCYQKFIHTASREPYFKNTIFVFVGDHGIPGDVHHMFPAAWTKQRLSCEHVPLLFYAPALIKPKRSHEICSQVDLLPTVAGLTGTGYVNTTLGRDLTDSTVKGGAFIFDPENDMIGVVRGNYFYRQSIHQGKGELVPIVNDPPPDSLSKEQRIGQLKGLSDALYETSKYLLMNNKKTAASD